MAEKKLGACLSQEDPGQPDVQQCVHLTCASVEVSPASHSHTPARNTPSGDFLPVSPRTARPWHSPWPLGCARLPWHATASGDPSWLVGARSEVWMPCGASAQASTRQFVLRWNACSRRVHAHVPTGVGVVCWAAASLGPGFPGFFTLPRDLHLPRGPSLTDTWCPHVWSRPSQAGDRWGCLPLSFLLYLAF